MGKYKSYIFLSITLIILLLVGYCVAKNSKEKKEEKEEKKENVNTPIPQPTNGSPEPEPTTSVDPKTNENPEPKGRVQITQEHLPVEEKEDIPSLKVGLKVGENNLISWNTDLKNSSKFKLQLVVYRKGQIYSEEDVTGKSSIIYDPSDYHENGKENLQGLQVRIELKITGNVKLLDGNSIPTDKILCSPKK